MTEGRPLPSSWHNQGFCIGEDPNVVFFPSHGDLGIQARQICAACAVRDDCLRYAIEADEFGIWGGIDQDERRNLRRRQRRKEAAVCGKTRQSEGAARPRAAPPSRATRGQHKVVSSDGQQGPGRHRTGSHLRAP
jgi:WhiB family transcriptional regulator, redox-sensing transcriptional regulator